MFGMNMGKMGVIGRAIRAMFSLGDLFTPGVNGAWYDPSDLTTLFQDAAGTTPVTAVEQPVGLILDKRDLAYSTYFDGTGDYLSTPSSTAFDLGTSNFTMEAWLYQTAGTSGAIANRRSAGTSTGWLFAASEFSANIGGSWRQSAITTTVANNNWIHVALVRNGSTFTLYHNGVSKGTYTNSGAMQDLALPVVVCAAGGSTETLLTGYISNLRIVKGTALYTANFTPPTAPLTPVAGTSLLTCGTNWSGNPAITRFGDTRADKLNPFTVGTGNHAYQTVSTKRPVLSARVNLLTKTEDFSNAAWVSATNSVAITKGTTTGTRPDGTTGTVNTLTFPVVSAGGLAFLYQNVGQTLLNIQATQAIYVRISSGTATVFLNIEDMSAGPSGGNFVAGSAETVTTSWRRISLTGTRTSVTGNTSYIIGFDTRAGAGQTNSSPVTIEVWGASLVPTNQASLPYQRVNTSTDYDTAGFPTYLKFDGIDDALQTNSIDFTATDKMTVFAGVRKLSDVAYQILAELGSVSSGGFGWGATAATGSQVLMANYSAPTASAFFSDGGINQTYVGALSLDRAGSTGALSEISFRKNGVSVTGSQDGGNSNSTGNFGNYPLYIGAREGTSLLFNGHLYGLIVRGAQSTAAQIESTEQWVNGKTAAF